MSQYQTLEQQAQAWVESYQRITQAHKAGVLANYKATSTNAHLLEEPLRSLVLKLLRELGLYS